MTPRLLLSILAMFALRLAGLAWIDHWRPQVARDYCGWDCNWYVSLAIQGYQLTPNTEPGPVYAQANWAFFPLYPLILHATAWLLPVSIYVAGLIDANLLLLLFVVTAVLYLPLRRGTTNRTALAAFLLAFPYGVYFSMGYTESLYAFLATATLFCLALERRLPSAVFAGLVSATHVPGVFFTPIVALRALRPAFFAWRAKDGKLAIARVMDALLPIALAPLGLFLFMAYLYAHMGDGLAFAHIQAGWGRHTQSPLRTLYENRFVSDWRFAFAKQQQSAVIGEYSALAGLLICGRLAWLRLWPECLVLISTIMLGLAAGLLSMQRYVLANPVFLIFLFDWLWQSVWLRRCFVPILLGCGALQLYFAHCWLEDYAFLM